MNKTPEPGPAGRLDRLGLWMRARKSRQWLVLTLCWLVGIMILFPAWIGVAFLRGSTDRDAGAVALNLVLVWFIAVVGLTVVHRAMYRTFWNDDRRRAAGLLRPGDPVPPFASEPAPPPPPMTWPWRLRIRHVLVYLLGMATLLFTFAPYRNQLAIIHFLAAHSAGRASAGRLSALMFGYVPMGVSMALIMLLTWRQFRLRDAGLLDPAGEALLAAETNWLFSFAAAFMIIVFLCRWAGGMIVETM